MSSEKHKDYRKSLRKNLTPAEATLWKLLKGKKLNGRKFRRQHSIGYYIVDFYCIAEKLVIELDGEYHNNPNQIKYDKKRDAYITSQGNKVLRFENKFVFEHREQLLDMITESFNKEP